MLGDKWHGDTWHHEVMPHGTMGNYHMASSHVVEREATMAKIFTWLIGSHVLGERNRKVGGNFLPPLDQFVQ